MSIDYIYTHKIYTFDIHSVLKKKTTTNTQLYMTSAILPLTQLAAKVVAENLTQDLITPFNYTPAHETRAFIKSKLKTTINKDVCKLVIKTVPLRALYVFSRILIWIPCSVINFFSFFFFFDRVRCKKCKKTKHLQDCFMWHYNSKKEQKKNNTPRKWRTEVPTYFASTGHITFTCNQCTPSESPSKFY
jgi:hypothetical protein